MIPLLSIKIIKISIYPLKSASTSAVIRSLTADTPTLNAQADFVSINSDSFTINWTPADGTERKIGWIALGPADTTPPTITIDKPTESSPVYKKGGEQFLQRVGGGFESPEKSPGGKRGER